MSPLPRGPVHDGRVRCDAVIPDDDRLRCPPHARLVIDTARNVCVQESKQRIALLFLEAHNTPREAGVDVQRLLASSGVRAHDWVLVGDRLATDDAAALVAELGLLDTGVDGLEAVQALLEGRREAVVGLDLVDEGGVAAGLGGVEDVEEGGSGGLRLVGDVRVPGYAAVAAGEEVVELAFAADAVDEVHLGVALWGAGGGVDVVATEVAAEVESILDGEIGKVLVAECDDLALGDEEGELVLAGGGELAELHATDFRASCGGQLGDFAALDKEILEGWVGANTVLYVLEWLKRRVLLVIVVYRKVVWVFCCGGTSLFVDLPADSSGWSIC